MDASFKVLVYQKCLELLAEKIHALKEEMHDLVENSLNDSKSSAGDKHETGRAMMQLEQAQLGKMLSGLEIQKSALERMHSFQNSPTVRDGSIVFTLDNAFFVSIPFGKIEIENMIVNVISGESPLGTKLKGKIAGEIVLMNGVSHTIKSVI